MLPRNIRLSDPVARTLLYTLFLFSGFSGLIYESIWTHYMKLFLGSAAYAQTLVLIIFMGGMALGSWAMGKYSSRVPNLILGYAIVEGLIGLLAIVFHWVFVGVIDFSYFTVIPKLHSPILLMMYKWGLAGLLILPQTILLGATFPLMSAGVLRLYADKPGCTLATLYFTNSLGAVAGVLASGYLLIGLVGLPGTIRTAGYINLLIAIAAWLIDKYCFQTPAVPVYQKPRQGVLSQRVFVAFLACSGLTGTASFMYEIGWIRMLSLVLGSSTHAFELMLSAFILGLALGGYWIKKRVDGMADPVKTLGIIQITMGTFALATLLLYGQTFNLMGYVMTALSRTEQGYFFFNLFSQTLAMIIMLPATICAGMTLPVITYCLLERGYGEGAIGKTYAMNTIGAIIGVLIGVQLVMPLFGVKYVILIGALIDMSLGLVLLWYARVKLSEKSWAVVTVTLAGFVLISALWVQFDVNKMASGVFRTGKVKQNEKVEIVFHKDGKTASVDVIKREKFYIISTNGKPDGSVGIGQNIADDELTQILTGALAWGMNDKAKTAATIGVGTGMTGSILLATDTLQSVDTVEIESAMLEGARGLGARVSNIFNDPRSHIYIDDAKAFFTNQNKKYDIIVSEPSNPWVSGVAGLFSKEFYRLIRNYLTEDGILVQWIHLYEIGTPLVASVMQALSESFEDYAIYGTDDMNIVIIAGKRVQGKRPSERLFQIPAMVKELNRVNIYSLQDLHIRYLGNKNVLDPLFKSYSITPNSDFFPVLDLNAVRDRFIGSSAMELTASLRRSPVPLLEVLNQELPPSSNLPVSKSVYFSPSQDARQAQAIYGYFGGPGPDPYSKTDPLLLDGESAKLVGSVRTINGQCRLNDIYESWLPDMLKLISDTAPYLSPRQMEVIWKDIETSRCYGGLSGVARDWLGVYKAVSYRDYGKALQYSKKLLPANGAHIKPSFTNNYLVMVALWSHIALNEKKEAASLAKQYENPNPPVAIRLLTAIANEKK
jgi:spermidine synthase